MEVQVSESLCRRHDVYLTLKHDAVFFHDRFTYPVRKVRDFSSGGTTVIDQDQGMFFITPCITGAPAFPAGTLNKPPG